MSRVRLAARAVVAPENGAASGTASGVVAKAEQVSRAGAYARAIDETELAIVGTAVPATITETTE
jgi:hypothetical protein